MQTVAILPVRHSLASHIAEPPLFLATEVTRKMLAHGVVNTRKFEIIPHTTLSTYIQLGIGRRSRMCMIIFFKQVFTTCIYVRSFVHQMFLMSLLDLVVGP